MKKTVIAALAAIACLCITVPAAAETYTSANGVLSIELPDESWKEIVDPTRWIVLSDGASMITVDHLSNGEKLPEMSVADEHYVNVYQAVFSTQNEVFIITGSVVDAAKIPEIANAIVSAKVLQYDTKVKLAPAAQPKVSVSDFSVVATDKTMYVTADGLNVRISCSADSQIIGAFPYGSQVRVTGVIQKNGTDFGWLQVDYNGGTGYVSSAYLSDTAPAAKEGAKKETSGITFTGNATTVYAMSGTAVTIYEALDGSWYDSEGTLYTWLSASSLSNEGGDSFSTSPYTSSAYFTGEEITVYSLSGTPLLIRGRSDGYWYTTNGTKLWWLDNERLESEGGEAFLAYDPSFAPYDNSDQEGEGSLVYCEYCGQWYEEGNVFRNHVCPYRDAAAAEGN